MAASCLAGLALGQSDSLTWQTRPPSPVAMHRTAGCYAGGYFYLMGGFMGGQETDSVFRYDDFLGVWESKAHMPFPTSNHYAVYLEPENRIYVFGGELQISYEYVQVYDIGRDSWFYRYMPYADYGMSAAVIGDSIFVAFGVEHPGLFYRYYPHTNDWSERTSFPDSAFNGAMCSLEGKLYFGGGWDSLKVFRRFDPAANAWSELADLPQGRHGLGLLPVGRLVYMVGGGQRWNTALDTRSVYAFDPDSGTWRYDSQTSWLHIAGAFGTYATSRAAYVFAVSGYNAAACEVGHKSLSGLEQRQENALPQTLTARPNPFRTQTSIRISSLPPVPRALTPVLRIYDAAGRLVRVLGLDCSLLPTAFPLTWDGSDSRGSRLSAGVYVLASGNRQTLVRKLD